MKDLLEKLKKGYLFYEEPCLCDTLLILLKEMHINEKEKNLLRDYIENNRKPRFMYTYYYKFEKYNKEKSKNYYLWKPRVRCPYRLNWIEKHIKLNS